MLLWQLAILVLALASSTRAQTESASTATVSNSTSTSTSTSTSAASTSTSAAASTSPASASASTPTISLASLPTATSLAPLNASSPALAIRFPAAAVLYITLNICSLASNASTIPTALVSASDAPTWSAARLVADADSGGVQGGPNGVNRRNKGATEWVLSWDRGFANWTATTTGTAPALDDGVGATMLLGLGMGMDGTVDAGVLDGLEGNVVVQLAVSDTGPLYSLSPSLPLLGDTTPASALLFSPLLLSAPHDQPTYPNYTLPPPVLPAQGPFSTLASQPLNLSNLAAELSLVVVPTTASPTTDGLDHSLCAVRAANSSTGGIASPRTLLVSGTTGWAAVGGAEGWRTMWVVGDLAADTNYTAWVVDQHGGMSGPIWFATKDSTFPCPLVLPTAVCPGIAYAAALPPNTTTSSSTTSSTTTNTGTTSGNVSLPVSSLPAALESALTASLAAFSTSLLSSACGRDLYSHVSSCADCVASYRDWLCRVSVPRCSSPAVSNYTVHRAPGAQRNAAAQPVDYAYDELLPCLAGCSAVDRACPVTLGFRCPSRHVRTAAWSYAFQGDGHDGPDGSAATGPPATDRWGQAWCNG